MSVKRITIVDAVEQQRRWIVDCGGSLAGYIKRYGAKDDPCRYGDGGEAIYNADMAELTRLIELAKDKRRKYL